MGGMPPLYANQEHSDWSIPGLGRGQRLQTRYKGVEEQCSPGRVSAARRGGEVTAGAGGLRPEGLRFGDPGKVGGGADALQLTGPGAGEEEGCVLGGTGKCPPTGAIICKGDAPIPAGIRADGVGATRRGVVQGCWWRMLTLSLGTLQVPVPVPSPEMELDSYQHYFYDHDSEEDFYRSTAPSEDIWKKFELVPTPPTSPACGPADKACCSGAAGERGDWLPGCCLAGEEPGEIFANLSAFILQDCMWSGFSARERLEKARSEKLSVPGVPRLAPHKPSFAQDLGFGHAATECVDPAAVFPCPLAESKIPASSGSESQSDSGKGSARLPARLALGHRLGKPRGDPCGITHAWCWAAVPPGSSCLLLWCGAGCSARSQNKGEVRWDSGRSLRRLQGSSETQIPPLFPRRQTGLLFSAGRGS